MASSSASTRVRHIICWEARLCILSGGGGVVQQCQKQEKEVDTTRIRWENGRNRIQYLSPSIIYKQLSYFQNCKNRVWTVSAFFWSIFWEWNHGTQWRASPAVIVNNSHFTLLMWDETKTTVPNLTKLQLLLPVPVQRYAPENKDSRQTAAKKNICFIYYFLNHLVVSHTHSMHHILSHCANFVYTTKHKLKWCQYQIVLYIHRTVKHNIPNYNAYSIYTLYICLHISIYVCLLVCHLAPRRVNKSSHDLTLHT